MTISEQTYKGGAILDVYRKHFGDVSFLFDDAPSQIAAMQLPYAVPSRILLPDSARRLNIDFIDVRIGRLHSIVDEHAFCLFDTHIKAASEIVSKVMMRNVDLKCLLIDLDACAADVLRDVIDTAPFNLIPMAHRACRLGPTSFEATWARGEPPVRFRSPSIEFRGASVWIVSATLSTSRLLLDSFGAISKTTARDIVIEVGQS